MSAFSVPLEVVNVSLGLSLVAATDHSQLLVSPQRAMRSMAGTGGG